MKVYVNTEQLVPISERLLSLHDQISSECSRVKHIAHNLQEQTIKLSYIYDAMHDMYDIENEINLLAQQLKQIKNAYDNMEADVLNDVQQLSNGRDLKKNAIGVTIYRSSGIRVSDMIPQDYIKRVPQIGAKRYVVFRKFNSDLVKNIKEYSKIANAFLSFYDKDVDDWIKNKLANMFILLGSSNRKPERKLDVANLFNYD